MANEPQSQHSSQAKSKFLADMSHEIRNAMKNIIIHSDQLKQTDLNVKQSEYLETIYENARRLAWITNDILDFSHMESGDIEFQSIDFNLEYLVNDLFRKTFVREKDHPVETYVDIAKDVPRDLVGDPTRLRQVLVNLLSNAFKFTSKGKIGIMVKKAGGKLFGSKDKVNLEIMVKDTGKGIPQDKLSGIFDLQAQGDPTQSWVFGGTGLGLSICKLITEAMGGSIAVESKEGEGSQFILNIPFVVGASLRERKVNPLTRNELSGKKAIIIDDDEIARKVLKKCCDSLNIETVLISASPKAVLQMLDELAHEDEVPDLILCDLMMPEMDGYEMMKRIKTNKKFQHIKSIAVTSAVHVGSAKNAQESGFSGFLPKPVFLDELAKVITTVLGDKREQKTIVTRHMAEELTFKETKVLVITGEEGGRKVLEDCLNELECERTFVSTGHEAIDLIREKIFDFGLMDFDIIEKESPEIVTTIKEVSRSMPVVVFLPPAKESRRKDCLSVGVDDFISKPVDMVSLKRIVQRYGRG